MIPIIPKEFIRYTFLNRTKNNFQDRFFEDVVPGIYKLLARENRTTKGFTSKSIRIVTNSSDGWRDYQYRLALRKLSHYEGNNLFLKADAEYDQS